MSEQLENQGFEKKEKKEKKKKGLYELKKEPPKSLQSYLRNQHKLMISTIALLDRKAMILIRINSTIVTALIVFQEYIIEHVLLGNVIGIILVIGALGSLILAILGVKPFAQKFIKLFEKDVLPNYSKLSENNYFLLEPMSLKAYEDSMDKVVRNQDLQIGNMVRINYVLNMIVRKKFLILDWAYNIFLASFILVTLVFIVSKFIVV